MKKKLLPLIVSFLCISGPVQGFSRGATIGSFLVENQTGHFYAIHGYDVYYFDRTYSQYPNVNSSWIEVYTYDADYTLVNTIELDPLIGTIENVVVNIDVHPNGTLYILLGKGDTSAAPPYKLVGIDPTNETIVSEVEIDFTSEKGNLKELLVTDDFIAIMMYEDENQIYLFNNDGTELKTLKLAPEGIASDKGNIYSRSMAYDGVGIWVGTDVVNGYRSNNQAVFYRFDLETGIQDLVINKNPDYPKSMEIHNDEIIVVTTDRVEDGPSNSLEATIKTIEMNDAKVTTTPEDELNFPFSFRTVITFNYFN